MPTAASTRATVAKIPVNNAGERRVIRLSSTRDSKIQALANGVTVRPITPHKILIDNAYRRLDFGVTVVEVTSLAQWNTNCRKVISKDAKGLVRHHRLSGCSVVSEHGKNVLAM